MAGWPSSRSLEHSLGRCARKPAGTDPFLLSSFQLQRKQYSRSTGDRKGSFSTVLKLAFNWSVGMHPVLALGQARPSILVACTSPVAISAVLTGVAYGGDVRGQGGPRQAAELPSVPRLPDPCSGRSGKSQMGRGKLGIGFLRSYWGSGALGGETGPCFWRTVPLPKGGRRQRPPGLMASCCWLAPLLRIERCGSPPPFWGRRGGRPSANRLIVIAVDAWLVT